MKQCFSFFLCVLFGLSFYSCQSDEPGGEPDPLMINAERRGTLIDGGQISDVSLYCIEKKGKPKGESSNTYYHRIKTVGGYSDFYLKLEFGRNEGGYQPESTEEIRSIAEIEGNYYKTKSSFIVEEYDKFKLGNHCDAEWPDLFTAYTNGEVSITCDKVLYGEEPETNLDKYFSVNKVFVESGYIIENRECLPVGIENPKMLYNFGEEIPSDMDKFFVKGTWLQPQYYLQFKELPTEKYDELTLSVTFPMIREHVRNYAVAKYRGETVTTPKLTEDVFKADCPIKFDWE